MVGGVPPATPEGGDTLGAECFLCGPDSTLLYLMESSGMALCGLGPITAGYTVVGATKHVRSAADAMVDGTEFTEFATRVRHLLSERFGSCLLTEHGRMPVCQGITGTAERHCYHAHFLLFPAAPSIVGLAVPYFSSVSEHGSLESALKAAASSNQEYFLVSPTPDQVVLLQRPRRIMRQFSRCLVAAALGRPQEADWQTTPDLNRARGYAAELRLLAESTGGRR